MRGNRDESLILTSEVRDLDIDFITPKGIPKPIPCHNSKTSMSKTPLTQTNESCSEELTISNLPTSNNVQTGKNSNDNQIKDASSELNRKINELEKKIGTVKDLSLKKELNFQEWNMIQTSNCISGTETSSALKTSSLVQTVTPSSTFNFEGHFPHTSKNQLNNDNKKLSNERVLLHQSQLLSLKGSEEDLISDPTFMCNDENSFRKNNLLRIQKEKYDNREVANSERKPFTKENVTQSLPQVSINRDDFFFNSNSCQKLIDQVENSTCTINKDNSMVLNVENDDFAKKIMKKNKNTSSIAKKPIMGNFIRNNSQKAMQNDSSIISNSHEDNNISEKVKFFEVELKIRDSEIKSLKLEKEEVNLENDKLKQVISELAQKVEQMSFEFESKFNKDTENVSCQTSLHYADIDDNYKKINKLESEISKKNVIINQINLENKILNQEIESFHCNNLQNQQNRSKKLENSAETTNNPSSTGNIEKSDERDSMFYEMEQCNTNKLHEHVNNFLKHHDAYQSHSNENTKVAKAQSLNNTASLLKSENAYHTSKYDTNNYPVQNPDAVNIYKLDLQNLSKMNNTTPLNPELQNSTANNGTVNLNLNLNLYNNNSNMGNLNKTSNNIGNLLSMGDQNEDIKIDHLNGTNNSLFMTQSNKSDIMQKITSSFDLRNVKEFEKTEKVLTRNKTNFSSNNNLKKMCANMLENKNKSMDKNIIKKSKIKEGNLFNDLKEKSQQQYNCTISHKRSNNEAKVPKDFQPPKQKSSNNNADFKKDLSGITRSSCDDHNNFLRNLRKNYSQSNSIVCVKSNDHTSQNHSNSKDNISASSKRKASETFESTQIQGILKSKLMKNKNPKSKDTSKLSNEKNLIVSENTTFNNCTTNLSNIFSKDTQSIEEIKTSVNKLGLTTANLNQKKTKNSSSEITNGKNNFSKTTKFSRLLGGRGGSCTGSTSALNNNTESKKNLANSKNREGNWSKDKENISQFSNIRESSKDKENISQFSNIRESSSKEFEKKGNGSYIHKNMIVSSNNQCSRENLGSQNNNHRKMMSWNATTKISNQNVFGEEREEKVERDRISQPKKRSSNESSYNSIRHKKRNPSYISSKFSEILNSSKVGSSNKNKAGINWNLTAKN